MKLRKKLRYRDKLSWNINLHHY